MTVTVHARELQFISGSSDKFYRIYQWDNTVAFQYGRNGTYGTFSRKKGGPGVAEKQYNAKYGKGYEPIWETTLTFNSEPTDSELDRSAGAVNGHGSARSGGPALKEHNVAAALSAFSQILQDTSDDEDVYRLVQGLEFDLPRVTNVLTPEELIRPMLADTIAVSDVPKRIADKDTISQFKLDGDRLVIAVLDGQVGAFNRQGRPKVTNVGNDILSPFSVINEGYWVFDGEVVGRTFWAFDMMAAGDFLPKDAPFSTRYEVLTQTLKALDLLESPYVSLLPNAVSKKDKELMIQQAQDDQREGVIFRDVNAPYEFGRRSTNLLKYKFIKEADVFVTRVGIKGKENAELAVLDADGKEKVVGQASTIGKGSINVGDVLEVRFLYVLDPMNPKMFQPRIMRQRTDKAANECSIHQFANAGTNKDA